MGNWLTRFYPASLKWDDPCPLRFKDWVDAEEWTAVIRWWKLLLMPACGDLGHRGTGRPTDSGHFRRSHHSGSRAPLHCGSKSLRIRGNDHGMRAA